MKTETQEKLYYVGMKNADTNVIHGIFNRESFYYPSLVRDERVYSGPCLYSLEEVKEVYKNALIFLEKIKKESVEYSNPKNGRFSHKKIKKYCNNGNVRLFIGKIKKKKIKFEEKSFGNQKIVT